MKLFILYFLLCESIFSKKSITPSNFYLFDFLNKNKLKIKNNFENKCENKCENKLENKFENNFRTNLPLVSFFDILNVTDFNDESMKMVISLF